MALAADALALPCATIDDVVARMDAVAAALPPADGVARFNQLYRGVTVSVRDAVRAGAFRDGRLLERLDVTFAGLYFRALAEHLRGARCPRSWRALFEARGRPRVSPLQFALAGMNAHINHDLAVALVETCAAEGVEPEDGTALREDYLAVNALLAERQAAAKRELGDALLDDVDRALGGVDDRVEHWSIVGARESAWNNARVLWTVRSLGPVRDAFLESLDSVVSVAGKGLLVPLQLRAR